MARSNQYRGRCHYCGEIVQPEAGILWMWRRRSYVAHDGCYAGRREEIKALKREARAQGMDAKRWRELEARTREANGLERGEPIPADAIRGRVIDGSDAWAPL